MHWDLGLMESWNSRMMNLVINIDIDCHQLTTLKANVCVSMSSARFLILDD